MIVDVNVRPFEHKGEIPIGLLVPEPPNTHHQQLVGMEMPCGTSFEILRELNSSQLARLFRVGSRTDLTFSFHFAAGRDQSSADIFADFDNPYTRIDGDVLAFLELASRPSKISVQAEDVVQAVQRKFHYGPRNKTLAMPTMFCGVETGSCLDINTLLVACLTSSGIPASYQAGYYFTPIGTLYEPHGMHCWVSTQSGDRRSDWDIAHCIQANLEPPVDSLNPKGGIRAAFSFGRGLRFLGKDVRVEPLNYFADPYWVFEDGGHVEAVTSTEVRFEGLQGSPLRVN